MLPSFERVAAVLRYEPETGLFYWLSPPKGHPRLRDYVAGRITSGYVMIKLDGKKHKAHRLAWLLTHGSWPDGDVDHANGCPLDNRISNLRIATNPQNQANRKRDHGKALPKGVRINSRGRFNARIRVAGKCHSLGGFATAEEAEAAYIAAAILHYGEFARAA